MSVTIRRNPMFPQMSGSWFGKQRLTVGGTVVHLVWIPGLIVAVSR